MDKIDELKAWGCNTDEALQRVVGDREMYMELISEYICTIDFSELRQLLLKGDTAAAFRAAHSIKGAVGNMGITPVYKPISAVADQLRSLSGKEMDAQSEAAISSLLSEAERVLSDFKTIFQK